MASSKLSRMYITRLALESPRSEATFILLRDTDASAVSVSAKYADAAKSRITAIMDNRLSGSINGCVNSLSYHKFARRAGMLTAF